VSESQRQVPVTSLPNMLGMARILATPIVMGLLLLPFAGGGLLALVLFAAAAITDNLDGRIARARGQVSPLGVFMDLTADKVLVAGVLVAMVEVDLLPAWMVALILIRELVIAGVRQLAFDARTGGPASSLGATGLIGDIGFWLMVLATVLTVISGWAYLRAAWPILSGSEHA